MEQPRPTTTDDRPLFHAYRDERAHLVRAAATLHYLTRQDEAALTAQAQLITCATNGTLDADLPEVRERILDHVGEMHRNAR